MKQRLTKNEMKQNLISEEKISLEIESKIDELSDPSIFMNSLIPMIIEFYFIGDYRKGKMWIEKTRDMLSALEKREITTTHFFRLIMKYRSPFVMSFCEGKPDWGLLQEYSDKYYSWAEDYYKNKQFINESIEDIFILGVITGKEKIIINKFSNIKIPPLADGFLKVLQESSESNLAMLKKKVIRRIRRNELMHVDNILLLLAYYKIQRRMFNLDEYFNWLHEFILE